MSPKEPRWLLGVICQCQSKSCGSRPCPERPRPQRPRGLCVRGPAGLNASRQASGASPAFSASSSVTVLPSTAAPASVPRPPGCWSLLLTSARRPPSSQPTPGLRALPPPPFTPPPPPPFAARPLPALRERASCFHLPLHPRLSHHKARHPYSVTSVAQEAGAVLPVCRELKARKDAEGLPRWLRG